MRNDELFNEYSSKFAEESKKRIEQNQEQRKQQQQQLFAPLSAKAIKQELKRLDAALGVIKRKHKRKQKAQ